MTGAGTLPHTLLPGGDARELALEATLAEGRTRQGDYRVVRLAHYGRAIVLDGLLQSCEFDETVYHEMLVAPACAWHGRVRQAVVLGGGNGGILNRLQHLPGLISVRHFDIDPILASLSHHLMDHLRATPEMAFDYALEFGDPSDWIQTEVNIRGGQADLVLLDLPDATDGTAMAVLFDEKWFRSLMLLLAPGGVLVTHVGQSHPADLDFQVRTVEKLRAAARYVEIFDHYIPSFGVPWGFALASNDPRLGEFRSHKMADRISALPSKMRRTYDPETHQHITHRPAFLRQAFAITCERLGQVGFDTASENGDVP